MNNHNGSSITIVSKSRLFRDGLKSLLSDSTSAEIQEVESPEDLTAPQNGIILLDAGSNPVRVIDDVGYLSKSFSDSSSVVLADVLEWQYLIGAITAGASGYLLKDISTEALLSSLKLVEIGEKVFPTNMCSLLAQGSHQLMKAPPGRNNISMLSKRENEILKFLVEGDSNKLIARRLNLTEATVKVHMKSLMRKLECNNRTQAAIWALHHGVFDASDESLEDDDDNAETTVRDLTNPTRPFG